MTRKKSSTPGKTRRAQRRRVTASASGKASGRKKTGPDKQKATSKRTTASTRKKPARKAAPARARKASARRQGPRSRKTDGAVMRTGAGILFRAGFVSFAALIALVAALYYYSQDLPDIGRLEAMQRPAQITLVDRNGELMGRYGELHGDAVEIDALPDHVVNAFLAIEDRNFYHHWGINPVAMLRALIVNIREGEVRQGGSTITQQFAKVVFLEPDRTIRRKVQEVLLALRIESSYSKDEILAFYLNTVYFGAGTYGLAAASERYFEKEPEELTVGEAAMLAGLLKAPSRYSPASSPDAARERARTVLQAMADGGFLTVETVEEEKAGTIARISNRRNPAPYATDFAMAAFNDLMPQSRRDVVIHTTFDLAAHRRAQEAMAEVLAADARVAPDVQAAMVAMETDGAVRLMIGGRDYEQSEYNRAAHARRQPGSAFKPVVYLAALEAGRRPDDIVLDTPVELKDWKPGNYKDRYYGAVPMAEAMARSLNAAAIHVQEETGRAAVIATAKRLGFSGPIDPGPALALGVNETTPLELAATYLPFAAEGRATEPYVITSVYDENGRVLYAREATAPRQAVAPDDVVALNHMLRQVVDAGSGRAASLAPDYVAMGKTGTSQSSRDAWFAGHAGGLTGVVWLGKDDNAPMDDAASAVSGSGAPAALWGEMMRATLDGREDVPYTEWSPKPDLPDFFRSFRDLFGARVDTQATPAPVIDMTGAEVDPAPERIAAGEPEAERPVDEPASQPSPADSLGALLDDVLAEDEAEKSLPVGDELGAFLQEAQAENATSG